MLEGETSEPVGLRRSKRSKFHLDVVQLLSDRRRPALDEDGNQVPSKAHSRPFKSRAKKKSPSPLGDAPLLTLEVPVLEPMEEAPVLEAAPDVVEMLAVEVEPNGESIERSQSATSKKSSASPVEAAVLLEQPEEKTPPSTTSPSAEPPSPELEERKPNLDLICPTCHDEFKSKAGYVSHIRACEKNGGRWKWRSKTASSRKAPDLSNGWMADDSEDASFGTVVRPKRAVKPTAGFSGLLAAKIEPELGDEASADGELNDSGDGDDLMPVLIPEGSLESTRTSTPSGNRKRPAGGSKKPADGGEKRLVPKRVKLTSSAHNLSLDSPFDAKAAAASRLQLPPVPQIIVNPPIIDKKGSELNCPECPYRTSDSNLLALHRILHRGERPYRCQSCTYNCFSADALHAHLDLHVPPLSPNSAATMRKRIAANKRNGLMNTEFVPPNAPNVIECNQCNFRTLQHERFVQHRLEHIQTQRQRLVCIIKRSAGDEANFSRSKSRLPQPQTKTYACKKCAFRVDHKEHLIHHQELHGSGLLYACRYCDYASDAASVRDFHEQHHHFQNVSLTAYTKNLAVQILKKKASEVLENAAAAQAAAEADGDEPEAQAEPPEPEESTASSSVASDDACKQYVPYECR